MNNKGFANLFLLLASLLLVILPSIAIWNGDFFRNSDSALAQKKDSNIIILLMGLILTYYSVKRMVKK
jgi:hypothetical protein